MVIARDVGVDVEPDSFGGVLGRALGRQEVQSDLAAEVSEYAPERPILPSPSFTVI